MSNAPILNTAILSGTVTGDNGDGTYQVSMIGGTIPCQPLVGVTVGVGDIVPVINVITSGGILPMLLPAITSGTITPNDLRDSFLWPFPSDSPWNSPIRSGATFVSSGIVAAGNGFGWDTTYAIKTSSSDPIVTWREPHLWNDRDGDPSSAIHRTDMHFPSTLIIADATGTDTPNNGATIVQPAGWAQEMGALTHSNTGTTIFGYAPNGGPMATIADLRTHPGYGSGCGHGGSGLSCLGGTIRKGELTSSVPFKHPFAIALYAHQYYKRATTPSQSFRWPAQQCDSYAGDAPPGGYGGSNANLMPGSLLAIQSSVDKPSAIAASAAASKIWDAMVTFGAYINEDTAWDHAQFSIDYQAVAEQPPGALTALGTLLNTYMMPNLSIVSNNDATHVGGGGSLLPGTSLAPGFSS